MRLIYCLIVILLLFIVSFINKEKLLYILIKPLSKISTKQLIYTNIIDGFLTYINISFIFSIIFAIPFILWQIFLFIKPGLYKFELLIAKIILLGSPLLFLFSIIFVYLSVIPKAWSFFYSFQDANLILLPNVNEYISLSITIFIAFMIAFQMPIIIIILNLLNLITIEQLYLYRRIMIFINFVIAGILTPPDVISQFMMAIPLILMYEAAIIICRIIKNYQKKIC